MNVYKFFQNAFFPPADMHLVAYEGLYPSALTASVSDFVPMILGLGAEIVLFRGVARDAGPGGLVLNTWEIGNVGLMVKALAAEWAAEWVWLEAQYWVNRIWCQYVGYQT